jgi:hypothetical protein
VTRTHYLTARCPTGCECWLHPKAVDAHVRLGRCLGHRWVDDAAGSAMVAGVEAAVLLAVLPDYLVDLPDRDGHAVTWLHGDRVVSFVSPILGVAPRRWSRVVLAAAARDGGVEVARVLDREGFAGLEAELGQPELVVCGRCGETVTRRGLVGHQRSSTRCRWTHAADEVRDRWADGWRDPFSVAGTPLSWTELQARACWRSRLRTVRFPLWTAVLLAP